MARQEIRTEVSGTVISVDVKAGDIVAEDETIAIIEAMKMEIPITSTAAGKVVELRLTEGEVVSENAIVATIEV